MGLTLSNAAVRPLTEDELKTAKDVLTARAASAQKVSPEKVASQIAVAAGEWVPAIQAGMQGVLQVRSPKLEAATRPFKEGMTLPETPQPVTEPFDPWTVAYDRPAGSTAQKDLILIPSTLEKKDCQACLGKSSVPCKVCFAKGTVNCDTCMGAGSQACGVCKGQASIACPDCQGSGKIKSGSSSNRTIVPCGSCGGAGKFNCNHCSGGKVDCGTCGNSGKKACQSCGGAGKQTCAVCAGSAKVVIGKGFQAEFRSQQAQAFFLGAAAPQAVVEMALSQKSAQNTFDFPSEEVFRKDLAAANAAEPIRAGLEQLLGRVRPPNAATRLGALKVVVAQGGAWRLTGAFNGGEFIYWIHPGTHTVIPEKDPVGEVGRKSAENALEAVKRGDWEAAVDSARDALSMDPHHAEARTISNQWRRRLLLESLLVGVAGGAVGALISSALIFGAAKGLYRMGPAIWTGALCLAVGLTVALGLLPVSRRLFSTRKRLATGGGGTLFAVLFFLVAARGFAGWNPVKSADQRNLAREMKENFKYGVSAVYHAPDLEGLQRLYDKYKDSQADLGELNQHILAQTELKTQHDALVKEFLGKLNEVRYSNAFASDKRAKVLDLKEHYALRNVDVTPAEEYIKELDEQIAKGARPAARGSRTPGKISITPAKKAPAKKAVVSKKAPAKPVKAKAVAKKPVAKKAVVKKKAITPNKVTTTTKKRPLLVD